MRKPSATKPSPALHEPTYFTDRDLGKKVAQILRENGLQVEVYFDHFEEGRSVADNEWLLFAARRKWIALSHDDNIRRDSEAVRTIMENDGRLFILRGAVPMAQLATLFLDVKENAERILGENSGPFIANVRRAVHRGGVMTATAEVMLTFAQWKAERR